MPRTTYSVRLLARGSVVAAGEDGALCCATSLDAGWLVAGALGALADRGSTCGRGAAFGGSGPLADGPRGTMMVAPKSVTGGGR
ncbi:MAG: hypothetical protein ACR2GW_02785 [Pyrinomonadaceae bacterium]